MVEPGVLEKYADITFDNKAFKSDHMYKVVFGNDIVGVHGKFIPTSW